MGSLHSPRADQTFNFFVSSELNLQVRCAARRPA